MNTITLDIDGVVAGGNYIPEWDRRVEVYSTLPLLDPMIPEYLDELCRRFHVYFVSGRCFPGALEITRMWLSKFLPLYMPAGVVTGVHYFDKPRMTKLLKSVVHVDDDPRVINGLAWSKGVWFETPVWATPIRPFHQRVGGWAELMPLLRGLEAGAGQLELPLTG